MKKSVASLFFTALLFFGVEARGRLIVVLDPLLDPRFEAIEVTDPWEHLKIDSYGQLKTLFTRRMYRLWEILPFATYKVLVDKFLAEAEKLNSIKYCEKHPQEDLAHHFLEAVKLYARADFEHTMGFPDERGINRSVLRTLLIDMNNKAKKKFNVDTELNNLLVPLIEELNQASYKALPWYARLYAEAVRTLPILRIRSRGL